MKVQPSLIDMCTFSDENHETKNYENTKSKYALNKVKRTVLSPIYITVSSTLIEN